MLLDSPEDRRQDRTERGDHHYRVKQPGGGQCVGGRYDGIAEALTRRDELSENDGCKALSDGNPNTRADGRHGPRENDRPEHAYFSRAIRASHREQQGVSTRYARSTIDDHRERGHKEHDRNLRWNPDPKPDHKQWGKCDTWRVVQNSG